MTGFDSKRQAAQAKLDDDDDTQVYADTLLIVYQRGFADGKRAAEQEPCVGKDPRCPCQDGDACHYKDCVGTKARPVAQRPWQGLTEQDMPSGEDPMFDHQYFCAGMVYAAKVLQGKNT